MFITQQVLRERVDFTIDTPMGGLRHLDYDDARWRPAQQLFNGLPLKGVFQLYGPLAADAGALGPIPPVEIKERRTAERAPIERRHSYDRMLFEMATSRRLSGSRG